MAKNMTQEEYKKIMERKTPASKLFTNCIKAFLIGGLICCVGQFFLNFYTGLGLEKLSCGGQCRQGFEGEALDARVHDLCSPLPFPGHLHHWSGHLFPIMPCETAAFGAPKGGRFPCPEGTLTKSADGITMKKTPCWEGFDE